MTSFLSATTVTKFQGNSVSRDVKHGWGKFAIFDISLFISEVVKTVADRSISVSVTLSDLGVIFLFGGFSFISV